VAFLFAEAKRIATDVIPAKILQLNEMLKSDVLSFNRLSEVRDVTVNSTQSYAVNTAAVDDGAPAQKRPRLQKAIVPTNRITADVTECHSLIRYERNDATANTGAS